MVEIGDMHASTRGGKAERDRLADALGGAGYERCAASEGDLHTSISCRRVSNDIGRRPSSMSWP